MFLPEKHHYNDYENKIREGLTSYLPGSKAQFRMAPVERPTRGTDHRTKKAGVLLLLFPENNEVATVFIQRPVYDGVHSGQISLPGGKEEGPDNNLTETALRETEEEIGIVSKDVKILGELTTLYIPASNILVQPVIGSMPYRPELKPDIREVERIFVVSMSELSDPSCIRKETFIENNKKFYAPYYKVDDLQIWGATAMILSEFIEVHTVVSANSLR